LKTALIVYEGMADTPSPLLEDRTPLEAARTPTATSLAVRGQGGCTLAPKSADPLRTEVALAEMLGLPHKLSTTLYRGPLEAIGAGLTVPKDAWVFRCDLVTLDDSRLLSAEVPRLSLEETRSLVESVQSTWDPEAVQLQVVAPGHAVAICRVDTDGCSHGVSPFMIEGEDWRSQLTRHRRNTFVRDFVERSHRVLSAHSVNEVRVDLKENPANALWLWGGGPALVSAPQALGRITMLTQSFMARGLAQWLGMPLLELADPWEVPDKKTLFKLPELVEALRETDGLCVYVEARQGGGRYGSPPQKVWALETLDHRVLTPLLAVMDAHRPYTLILTTDSAVYAATGKPGAEMLPFVVVQDYLEPDAVGHWDETACARGAQGMIKRTQWSHWWK
jgi:2,3-bisphosphoglycerate-independent phosphoglycerate mutase